VYLHFGLEFRGLGLVYEFSVGLHFEFLSLGFPSDCLAFKNSVTATSHPSLSLVSVSFLESLDIGLKTSVLSWDFSLVLGFWVSQSWELSVSYYDFITLGLTHLALSRTWCLAVIHRVTVCVDQCWTVCSSLFVFDFELCLWVQKFLSRLLRLRLHWTSASWAVSQYLLSQSHVGSFSAAQNQSLSRSTWYSVTALATGLFYYCQFFIHQNLLQWVADHLHVAYLSNQLTGGAVVQHVFE